MTRLKLLHSNLKALSEYLFLMPLNAWVKPSLQLHDSYSFLRNQAKGKGHTFLKYEDIVHAMTREVLKLGRSDENDSGFDVFRPDVKVTVAFNTNDCLSHK